MECLSQMIRKNQNIIIMMYWLPNMEIQKTKVNHRTKNIVRIVIKTIMVSEKRDEEYQKYQNQRPRKPQQAFVQYVRSKPLHSQDIRTLSRKARSQRDSNNSY